MARKDNPDRWTLRESFGAFLPWSDSYRSMRARNARTGVRFILPFIIGFCVFMLMPLIQSLQFALSAVTLVPGKGYTLVWNNFNNFRYAFTVDASFNQSLVNEASKMVVNTIATLVLSFVLAVILNQNFRGRALARAIFFLPVILSSGVLAGIEQTRENFNMMAAISEEAANASGVNLSASLQSLLSGSGVGGGVFGIVFDMIDAIYAGNTTSAETSNAPTRFMARTIIAAMMIAIRRLNALTFTPVARAKFSSNVMAKILW